MANKIIRNAIIPLSLAMTFAATNAFSQNNKRAETKKNNTEMKTTNEFKNSKLQVENVSIIYSKANVDSLVKLYSTPSLIQRYIQENFEYDTKNYDGVRDGLDEYATLPRILESKRGDCSEGFVISASLLRKLGYEVYGLTLTPTDTAKAGHVFCVYKDKKTGKYGSIGIKSGDYTYPSYTSLKELANDMALACGYMKADAQLLAFSDKLFTKVPKVKLNATPLTKIDLYDKFRVFFSEKSMEIGKVEYKTYEDGFKINVDAVLDVGKPVGKLGSTTIIDGAITYIWISASKTGMMIDISSRKDLRNGLSASLSFYPDSIISSTVNIHDNSKSKSEMTYGSLKFKKGTTSSETNGIEGEVVLHIEDMKDYLQIVDFFTKSLRVRNLLEQYGYRDIIWTLDQTFKLIGIDATQNGQQKMQTSDGPKTIIVKDQKR